MLTYEYRCGKCDTVFERRHSIMTVPQTAICACGGEARKLLGTGSTVDTKVCSSKFPYVSSRLPRNLKGCKTIANGKPIIQNRQHQDRVFQTNGYVQE